MIRSAEDARGGHRLQDARRLYEDAVAILRERDEPFALAHAVRHLGDVHFESGQADLAAPCYDEALALYRGRTGAPALDVANAIRSLAVLKERAGDWSGAILLWREAHELYVSTGVTAGVVESERRVAALTGR